MKKLLTLALLLMGTSLLAQHNNTILGIQTGHLSDEKAQAWGLENQEGILITKVYPKGGAKKAGLQPFDYITQINQQAVNPEKHLSSILNQYQPGQIVQVNYMRNGQAKQTNVALSSSNDDLGKLHRSSEKDPFLGISAKHMSLPQGMENGIPVNVVDNSTAQAMGMKSGDIITQIDDFKVINWHDMDPAIDNRNVGDAIQVTYYRNGELMVANRPIKSRAATHNDHSRPEGPVVIEPEQPSSEISEAILEDALEEEILALELALQPQETTEAGGASIRDESDSVRSFEQIEGAQLSFEELKVFPNPSTGIFDVQFDLPEEGRTAIRIYNPKGQAIYFNNLGDFSGVFSDRIDIANSMKGTYFLELSQDDKRLVRKLILQ